MKPIAPRFDIQDQTLAKMEQTPILFDTSDPGTGKTRCQLDAIAMGSGNPALVLAPLNLLVPAWVNDCEKFTPHLNCSVAFARNRADAFKRPADIYITNIDAASWLAQQSSKFFERFDRLIIDESSNFKNPFSKRSKAMDEIVKYFEYRSCLTGTPNPQDITDIWHQVYMLDLGERLGELFYAFRNVTCDGIPIRGAPSPYAKKWVMKPGVETTVAQLIADINIRHKLTDVPENMLNVKTYDMNKAARKEYEQLKKTAILRLQEGLILGTNAAVLLNKLLQACSGSVYTSSGHAGNIDNQRTDLIIDLIEERQNCVVFFQWTHQRDALIQTMKKKKITYCLVDGSINQKAREQAIKRFQAGMYKVFLAHPASTAHGLTLTRATSTIWASLNWNLEHFIQGNRRIHRAGQTQRTETVVILAQNTVEQEVYSRLKNKDKVQSTVLDVLEILS